MTLGSNKVSEDGFLSDKSATKERGILPLEWWGDHRT